MTIVRKATSGTSDSSDAFVIIEPSETLEINVESVVFNQYGKAITEAVRKTLKELGVEKASVSVKDRGAIDCVIQARVETAVIRASQEVKK